MYIYQVIPLKYELSKVVKIDLLRSNSLAFVPRIKFLGERHLSIILVGPIRAFYYTTQGSRGEGGGGGRGKG